MSSRRRKGAPHGVTYRIVWGHSQDIKLGRPQDVIFQGLMEVGRGRPHDVGRGRPLALRPQDVLGT